MKTLLILPLLALGPGAALPGAAQGRLGWEWSATMGRPASGSPYPDTGAGGALPTADGGAIVNGNYLGYLAFGPMRGDTLRAIGGSQALEGFLVKYSASGRKQWALTVGGSARGVTGIGGRQLDNAGNVLCSVTHDGSLLLPGGGTIQGAGESWYRCTSAGAFVGAGLIGRGQWSGGVSILPTNEMLMVGSSSGPGLIGTRQIGRIGGYDDSFVAKLDANFQPLWLRPITSSSLGGNLIRGSVVLPNGDLLIGGSLYNNATLDPAYQFVGNLGFMARYSGATGAILWARTVSVPVRPLLDPGTGQVYVAGEFKGRLNLDGVAATAPLTKENLFIARFDAVLGRGQSLVWAGGGPEKQTLHSLNCQPGVGFTLNGTGIGAADFGPGFGLTGATPTSNVSYVLQVSLQGMPQAFYETPANASPGFVSVDPAGQPFLTTQTSRPVRFGQLPIIQPRGNAELVLAHVGLILGTKTAAAQAAGLAVYPNPAAAAAGATITTTWRKGQVRVLDALGRLVWTGPLVQGRAELPPAPGRRPGFYVVQVVDGHRSVAQRLVLE